MGDRWVVIAVSLLTLIVMCGLLVGALRWVPGQIDRLDTRLDKLEELTTQVTVMHDKIVDLGKLEERLRETTLATAPLARIDASVDEITTKLNKVVVPAVNHIKGPVAARSDVDRIAGKANEISQKLAALAKIETEIKKVSTDVSGLKAELKVTRDLLEKTSKGLTKDLKRMELNQQKLEHLIKQSARTEESTPS